MGITSSALFFYSFGLLSCCFIKILVNAFYAMQDTRTPVRTMLIAVALNIALSLALMRPLKIGGLTLASTISATVNAAMLYWALRKKIGSLAGRRFLINFLKVAVASAVLGAACWTFTHGVLEPLSLASRLVQSVALFGGIGLGAVLYAGICWALGVEEIRKLLAWKRG